ncbi:maleylpyruvate isomerase family mycothiol-dependent enzyme [Nonomuraea insulae]|uniref:Maleylpyruvate isomerase family mycothiol-dependent enzyme n=1 Tax=Nonomuraea insulae TaxID=1616787 RepID=A0ABW1DA58_9ACTN
MTVLPALQAELTSATNQLLATAASLTDADLTAPSLLPGWTRGHVLAHLTKNADSYINLLIWARTGIRTPQYASYETRAAEIEAIAAHPAVRHLADLEDGAARFATAVRDLPTAAWRASVEGMRPPPHPAWYVLVRRLREIAFHHVDLASGYGPANWPDSFVHRELHDCLASWPHARSTVSEIILLLTPSDPTTAFRPTDQPRTTDKTRPSGTDHPHVTGPHFTHTDHPRPTGSSDPRFTETGTRDLRPIHKSPMAGPAGRFSPPTTGIVAHWRGLGLGPAVQGTPRDTLAWLTGRSGGEGVSLLPVGQSFTPGPGGTRLPEPPPWLTMPAPADLPTTPPKDYP